MASGGDSPRALREALLDAHAEEAALPPLAPAPPPRPSHRRVRTWLRACALLLAAVALGFAVFMMVMADSMSRTFGGNGWRDWFRRGPRLRSI
jgi:ferric-dicitrate binding protein FerR (iron transport regulator)